MQIKSSLTRNSYRAHSPLHKGYRGAVAANLAAAEEEEEETEIQEDYLIGEQDASKEAQGCTGHYYAACTDNTARRTLVTEPTSVHIGRRY